MSYMDKGTRPIIRKGEWWDGKRCTVCGGKYVPLFDGRELYCLWIYGPPKEPPVYLPKSPFCMDCASCAEHGFVTSMALEDLPLWLGHRWVYETSERRYLLRLERGV